MRIRRLASVAPACKWPGLFIALFTASLATSLAMPGSASAHGPIPPSLKGTTVPAVPGLDDRHEGIVRRQRKYLIALGKALFWDTQVGSDGVACATCHHHAGADGRTKNQLSPGRLPELRPTAGTFESTGSGAGGGSNYSVLRGDFPLHRLADPTDISSSVQFTTDDIIGSAGTFSGQFNGSIANAANDDCARSASDVFHVGGIGTRQVTSRHTPSVINSGFSKRLFWDGRANARFNGVNAHGPRDPDARVWNWDRRERLLSMIAIDLPNSSLASQAVEPPLDTTEMACANRSFADIGRKLLLRRPLQFQTVHKQDGVLGRLRDSTGLGLRFTYERLVEKAFQKRFWSATPEQVAGALGSPAVGEPYTQAEANFALFFGLAIQAYEATLVSDDSPYDSERDLQGLPTALNAQQRNGLTLFMNLHCGDCHSGATFAGATSSTAVVRAEVDRKPIRASSGQLVLGLTDAGFLSTSVTPQSHDPGVGGTDPFGIPFSLTAQYRQWLTDPVQPTVDPMTVRTCAMTSPFGISTFGQPAFLAAELDKDPAGTLGCADGPASGIPSPDVADFEMSQPSNGRLVDGTVGAFKVPTLRNVELTGPYMHNGSMATLEEVVEFYARGGNFASQQGKDAQFLFGVDVSAQDKADLVAFLESLTDERVRWERAPFDHPSLPLPVGHVGNSNSVVASADPAFAGLAETQLAELPAVGAQGRDIGLGPLLSFEDRLTP